MAATYSMKQGRRYRFLRLPSGPTERLTLLPPTKAISVSLIEDSPVGQLRVRLNSEATRSTLRLPQRDWQAFLHDPTGLVPVLVETVRYDGATGTVSVQLRNLNGTFQEADLNFEYKLPIRRVRMLPEFPLEQPEEPVGRPARIARLVALSHKLEQVVQSGTLADLWGTGEMGASLTGAHRPNRDTGSPSPPDSRIHPVSFG